MATHAIETRLLGILLDHPIAAELAAPILNGTQFSNPTLGGIYDHIVSFRSRGIDIDADTLPGRYIEWGLAIPTDAPAPITWSQHDRASTATELATLIRSDHIRNAGITAINAARGALADQTIDPYTTLAEHARTILATIDTDIETDDDRFYTLEEIMAMSFEHNWIIPGLLERQDRLVLTGHEGSGKSEMIKMLALCASAGLHPFDITPIEPSTVMVIDAENSLSQWQDTATTMATRIAQVGQRDPRKHIKVMCRGRMNLRDPRDEARVHRWIDRHKPDMLAIGPLYKLLPDAIKNDDDAAPLIAVLDGFRERGITLIMEAHAGHATGSDGSRDLRPRGSSALLGWPEFGYGIRPVDGDPSMAALVRWRGDRSERYWPAHIRRGGLLSWTRA